MSPENPLNKPKVALWGNELALLTTMILVGPTAISLITSRGMSEAEICRLAVMPLEGTWQYELPFSNYRDRDGNYVASGIAQIYYSCSEQYYEVLLAYTVTNTDCDHDVVAGYAQGKLVANNEGWPENSFSLKLFFKGRKAAPDLEAQTNSFTFTNGAIIQSPKKERAETITFDYKSETSEGKVDMTRFSGL